MPRIVYEVVPHDEGWAYKADGVFSETFASREEATAAAYRAAREQETPGETEVIEYQDNSGRWHTETSPGGDRPEAEVDSK